MNFEIYFVVWATWLIGAHCHEEEIAIESIDANVLDQIKSWWQEMSVQKPLKKCEPHKEWIIDSPLLKLFRNQIPVISYPCGPSETPMQYSFRGSIKDGQLNGPGKLKLGQKIMIDDRVTCIKLNHFEGFYPQEVVGTFVDGVLDGNAKIVFSNGKVLIGGFVHGLLEGFHREWDESGNLTFVGFSYKGAKIGKAWQKIGRNLVYSDVATINRSDDLAIVLPYKDDTKNLIALAGKLWLHIGILDEAQEVEIINQESIDQSCILKLFTKATGKTFQSPFYFPESKFINEPPHTNCNQMSWQNSGPVENSTPSKLEKWLQDLNIRVLNKALHQFLLQMRQDNEEPASGSQIISDIQLNDDDNDKSSSDLTPSLMTATFFDHQHSKVYIGQASFDNQSRFHGLVQLQVYKEAEFDRNFGFELRTISRLSGVFNHGVIQGLVQLESLDGRSALVMAKSGVIHGPAVFIGSVPILPDRFKRPVRNPTISSNKISFVGSYKNGQPYGSFWYRMVGGGYMHGKFNDEGKATGNDLAFIYPDMNTALVGRFEDFVMKTAHEAEVLEARCNPDGLVVISKFDNKSGPAFYYEAPTFKSFGAGPYGVIDPYERKRVQIATSSVPNSGEGVFALKDFPEDCCTCYYSGFLYDDGDEANHYTESCIYNNTLSMDERRECKKYTLGLAFFKTLIDIPPEFDKPGMFQPTAGPKVNHNFRLHNSAYSAAEHPRWGNIMCVESLRPIKAGEELYTYYGYQETDPPNDFPWYFELKKKIEAEEAEEQKKIDEETKKTEKKKTKKKRKAVRN